MEGVSEGGLAMAHVGSDAEQVARSQPNCRGAVLQVCERPRTQEREFPVEIVRHSLPPHSAAMADYEVRHMCTRFCSYSPFPQVDELDHEAEAVMEEPPPPQLRSEVGAAPAAGGRKQKARRPTPSLGLSPSGVADGRLPEPPLHPVADSAVQGRGFAEAGDAERDFGGAFETLGEGADAAGPARCACPACPAPAAVPWLILRGGQPSRAGW